MTGVKNTTFKPSQASKAVFKHRHQRLDLTTTVSDLVRSMHLSQADADSVLSKHRSAEQLKLHPLEYIASLELSSASEPGKNLELEWLIQWLATLSGQEYFAIDPLKIDASAVTPVMSRAYALRHEILAVDVSNDEVVIASAHPWYTGWEDNLQHVNRKTIRRVVANPVDIRRFTTEFYRIAQSIQGAIENDGVQSANLNSFEQMLELGNMKSPDANDQHIVNIVDWLLQYAFEQRASDIHVEPRRDQCHLRFRIDGVLHSIYQMPAKVAAAVTSRLKILGRMNVAEKRKPQDGRLKTVNLDGNEVELRLSTLPTAFGEKLVMRIFDPEVLVKGFSDLGFSREDERRWTEMTSQPSGIVLVTGPTGSGKTTTLYSTLKKLATEQVNVCTIEDPIEMVEASFNQMQVQHNIDLTFASGLRALLRQDPDIIMVGEIRDLETADMAIQAALTGHLVISTLHTNDAPSAVTRLMELGVPAYLIKATLLGIMAQRLVRTLCPSCKQPVAIDQSGWQSLTKPWSAPQPAEVFSPVGCQECRETGYHGRAGVYEIMPMSETLCTLLNDDADIHRIRRQAAKEGMYSLRLSGAQKVASGLTTVEEVIRVTPDHNNH
ncbi:general secretion pathway protein E [Endozoicomonas sp. NE40]|uniref:General secretion pathway protein E n=2 Tax=Endozoicomonas lisbonensis TaxID=3120522 RepID=A0ABV2SG46_9GAMM